jgi:MFS family permease
LCKLDDVETALPSLVAGDSLNVSAAKEQGQTKAQRKGTMRWPVLSLVRRNREFALLLAAQIISSLGDQFYSVGLMVTIYDKHNNNLGETTTTTTEGTCPTQSFFFTFALQFLASRLPAVFLGPLAGVIADTWPRRRVMLLMLLARAALILVLIPAHDAGSDAIFVLLFLLNCCRTINAPSYYALIRDVVVEGSAASSVTTTTPPVTTTTPPKPKKASRKAKKGRKRAETTTTTTTAATATVVDLVTANVSLNTCVQVVKALGYAIGGYLVLHVGFKTLAYIDVATFAIAAAVVACMSVDGRRNDDNDDSAAMTAKSTSSKKEKANKTTATRGGGCWRKLNPFSADVLAGLRYAR